MDVVRMFEGKKSGSIIYHVGDGWYYHGNIKRPSGLYLKCIHYDTNHCHGRAVLRRNPVRFEHLNPHDQHPPDVYYADEVLLRNNILRRCRQLECESFSNIVSSERRRFNIEVRARVTLCRMRTAMRNARMESFPQPAPRNLQELTAILQDPRYEVLTATVDNEDNIYAGSVTDVLGCHHVLFASQRSLEFLTTCTWVHGDGTIKIVPALDGISQVFVIVSTWNYHILGLAYVLMESKTQEAYEAVLTLLRNQLGPNLTRKIVMTDYERGQQNAWESIFPDCDLLGCLFHLVRAFLREALVLGLRHHLRNTPEVRRIFNLYCALPLLPLRYVRQGYLVVLQESRAQGPAVFRICRPFSAYVLRYWINDENRLRWMSVYRSAHRTNNASESHNSTLKRVVTVHPNIYHFINALINIEHDTHTDMESLRRPRAPVSRARKATAIRNDRALRRLEATLRNPPGPIEVAILEFLAAAAHRLQNIINRGMDEMRPQRRR